MQCCRAIGSAMAGLVPRLVAMQAAAVNAVLTADSHVSDGLPTTNFGVQGFVRFDPASALPAGTTVATVATTFAAAATEVAVSASPSR